MERTWGYSGQVSEWEASLPIPEGARRQPVAAVRDVLGRIRPVLEPLHRPRRMQLSWVEYDHAGIETAFHAFEYRTDGRLIFIHDFASGGRASFDEVKHALPDPDFYATAFTLPRSIAGTPIPIDTPPAV